MDDLTISVVVSNYMLMSSAFLQVAENAKRNRRKRRWWVRDIFKSRQQFGDSYNLVNEMMLNDRESFYNYTRMSFEQFEKLLNTVGPRITKYSIRQPLSAKDRLLITLRFLATGINYSSLSYAFRVSKSVIHNIIKETTEQIWATLHEEYIGAPDKNKLKDISEKFFNNCGMPHCIGAIDGKHCTIQAPPSSGSLYFNYKKQFSIVLMAVCDADCNFIYANVGAYGSESDGGALRRSEFGQDLLSNNLDFPDDNYLPNSSILFPYYIVGDEAFPLKRNLLRPYGGRNISTDKEVFNRKLTSARRTIENSFGIMVSKFRIYHTPIMAHPEVAKSIIKSTIVLHNFIRKTRSASLTDDLFFSLNNSNDTSISFGNLNDISTLGSNRPSNDATYWRNLLKDYLNNISPSN